MTDRSWDLRQWLPHRPALCGTRSPPFMLLSQSLSLSMWRRKDKGVAWSHILDVRLIYWTQKAVAPITLLSGLLLYGWP